MTLIEYLRSVFFPKPPVFNEVKKEPDIRDLPPLPSIEPKKTTMINELELKLISPGTPDNLIPGVSKWFSYYASNYEVDTPARIAAFLAQLVHESNSFKAVREYATGSAYEGRKDLGNIYKGDGVKFKGRGYIQITGRNNYAALSKFIFGDNRLTNNPELLATPQFAMLSAFWYWDLKNLNKYADYPVDQIISTKQFGKVYPFEWISILINGGRNGLQDRINNYNRIATLLNIPNFPKK